MWRVWYGEVGVWRTGHRIQEPRTRLVAVAILSLFLPGFAYIYLLCLLLPHFRHRVGKKTVLKLSAEAPVTLAVVITTGGWLLLLNTRYWRLNTQQLWAGTVRSTHHHQAGSCSVSGCCQKQKLDTRSYPSVTSQHTLKRWRKRLIQYIPKIVLFKYCCIFLPMAFSTPSFGQMCAFGEVTTLP